MGAVMGSKNLKAIAASGAQSVTVAEPQALFELCQGIAAGTKEFRKVVQDTAGEVTHHAEYLLYGIAESLPPDGWPGPEGLLGALRKFIDQYGAGVPTSCQNCPGPCKPAFKIPDPEGTYDYTVLHCDTWLMFTTRTKSIEFDFVKDSQIYMQCQKLGIDVFSATSDVAFLIELFEKGIITEKDTDGLVLRWNDRDILAPLIEKIARKEGIGALFQKGIRDAARQIGKGAEEYVYDTHGLELVHYPLYLIDAALGGAVSQRKDQVRAHSGTLLGFSAAPKEFLQMVTSQLPPDVAESVLKDGYITRYEGKAGLVEHFESINSVADLVGQCRWWMGGVMLVGILTPESRAQMLSLVTGREYTADDLALINERVETLIRAFNLREGLTKKDDTIPKFYFEQESPKYGFKLDEKQFEKILEEYYDLRGWDKDGIPKKERLQALGLDYVEEDLKKRGIMQ
jgi:aldehyde:ferredoxin oxidoreductase